LLLSHVPVLEILAYFLLRLRDKLLVSELVMTQLRGQPRPAKGEVVGPQAADGVLGQLCEEQRGEGAEGEVTEVAIELHQEPGDAAVTVTIVSQHQERDNFSNSLDWLPPGFLDSRGPDDLHNEDEGDGQQAPEGHTDHNGHLLLTVRVFQSLVIAEESSEDNDDKS